MKYLRIMSSEDVRNALSTVASIDAQKEAFVALAEESAIVDNIAHRGQEDDSLVFALTGLLPQTTGIVCKFGMQVPRNRLAGLPTVQGVVSVLDPVDGTPLACMDGATITTMRTAHGLVAAADVLARKDASSLGVLGSGTQAREVIEGIAAVRDLKTVRVWSPTYENRVALERELSSLEGVHVVSVDSPKEAVIGADIIATCTLSREPIVDGNWLSAGSTVLTMGSYQPDRRELHNNVTARSTLVVVDEKEKAEKNGGCVIASIRKGDLDMRNTQTLGDIILKRQVGRLSPEDIIVFHSMGLGIQDAMAGWAAYKAAVSGGYGTEVPF